MIILRRLFFISQLGYSTLVLISSSIYVIIEAERSHVQLSAESRDRNCPLAGFPRVDLDMAKPLSDVKSILDPRPRRCDRGHTRLRSVLGVLP